MASNFLSTIVISHEIFHWPSSIISEIGFFFLSPIMYMHYKIFHINIHHRYVGTEKDPITAPINMPINKYIF